MNGATTNKREERRAARRAELGRVFATGDEARATGAQADAHDGWYASHGQGD